MSRTRFRVNRHSIIAWMVRNSLVKTDVISVFGCEFQFRCCHFGIIIVNFEHVLHLFLLFPLLALSRLAFAGIRHLIYTLLWKNLTGRKFQHAQVNEHRTKKFLYEDYYKNIAFSYFQITLWDSFLPEGGVISPSFLYFCLEKAQILQVCAV